MRSKKPEAVNFQDWVFEEVLPSLRRTGSYTLSQPSTSSSPHQLLELRCENSELKNRVLELKLEKTEIESRIAIARANAEKQIALVKTDAEKQVALVKTDAEKQITLVNVIAKTEIAAAKTDVEKQVALVKTDAEKQIARVKTDAEKQIALAGADRDRRIAEVLLAKDHEISSLQRDFRHDQKQIVYEFRNIMMFGAGRSAKRVDAAEVRAELMEERATDAETEGARVQRRLQHLHETASIAPTEALRERAKNPLLVLFSEENGKYFSVSRLQACTLKSRRYSQLVDGAWVPNHKSPHFMALPEYQARRLLLCVEVANAVGSWALIRTTDLRLFFGTHPLERSAYLFNIIGDTMLERHYTQFCASLAEMQPNAKMTSRLARFAAEEFVDLADFKARCRLGGIDELCAVIRGAVAIKEVAATTVAPQRPTQEHRMITRKRARDETMRELLETLHGDGCNLFSENVKRGCLNKEKNMKKNCILFSL